MVNEDVVVPHCNPLLHRLTKQMYLTFFEMTFYWKNKYCRQPWLVQYAFGTLHQW